MYAQDQFDSYVEGDPNWIPTQGAKMLLIGELVASHYNE